MGLPIQHMADALADTGTWNGTTQQKVDKMDAAKSFEDWYDEYFDKVNRYLRYRVKNRWDADDLTTTVFIKAFEKQDQWPELKSFGAWIFRIAHNAFIDYVRRKKEVPSGDSHDFLLAERSTAYQPEQSTLHNEMLDEVQEMLHKLPPDQRDVLMLRYFGELKIAEVANVLNRTESSVKMLTHRGLKRFRQQWEEGDLHE
jgi:RNA polymerase sigma factor (sigma-70 family)